MTTTELADVLRLHSLWRSGDPSGARADLAGADLAGADLAGADLAGADLAGANLARAKLARAKLAGADLAGATLAGADIAGADLAGANLAWANLAWANLAWANLARAKLAGADIARANLNGADLAGANLARADLAGADLKGATLPGTVPLVESLHERIAESVGRDGERLDMSRWHCGTKHCRAGWAITLAGKAGAALEALVGPSAAGALIYAKAYPDEKVPDFYAFHNDALADIARCAKR